RRAGVRLSTRTNDECPERARVGERRASQGDRTNDVRHERAERRQRTTKGASETLRDFKMTTANVEQMDRVLGTEKKTGKLGRMKRKTPYVPNTVDPAEELRQLVKQHQAYTRKSVAVLQMASDRKNRATGETIKCDLADDDRLTLK